LQCQGAVSDPILVVAAAAVMMTTTTAATTTLAAPHVFKQKCMDFLSPSFNYIFNHLELSVYGVANIVCMLGYFKL
jgi:hypothetical protein